MGNNFLLFSFANFLLENLNIFVNTSITVTDLYDLDLDEVKLIRQALQEAMKKPREE